MSQANPQVNDIFIYYKSGELYRIENIARNPITQELIICYLGIDKHQMFWRPHKEFTEKFNYES